ncbi:DNA repair protein XRCC4 [Artemisia annua]|uniref:DNA repair protein XRCC4 n=1 Tax=Artemisia annua TaxID=35608 RepID=A0A2U1NX27_ARTAN|nr:DNA repair protein XRCC4 [Artemisia annua]
MKDLVPGCEDPHVLKIDISVIQTSEDEVKERASNWDQPVSEYIDMSERYLGFQQPGSVYAFSDAGGGGFKRVGPHVKTEKLRHRDQLQTYWYRFFCWKVLRVAEESRNTIWSENVSVFCQKAIAGWQIMFSYYAGPSRGISPNSDLSWTFEKEGTKLEWRWKFKPAENSKEITAGILDFLMDANIRLSEEVVMKTRSNEKLKSEAEKCLAQSEKFQNEKAEFETKIYSKFLGVLNSKKAKLRELRDKLSNQGPTTEVQEDEEVSTDKTETFDGDSEDENMEEDSATNVTSTSMGTSGTSHASEDEVKERASNWDQPVSEYIDMSERYLGFQQPGSVYAFSDAGGGGFKRLSQFCWKVLGVAEEFRNTIWLENLSWTFEKEGTKLEWRWKFKPAEDSKEITAGILDFLMDANIRLSEEVVMKTRSNEKLKSEAEKCLAQSEKFQNEKTEFETKIYSKFLGVLNSKKAKLRELRDKLSNQGTTAEVQEDEEESTDKTETFDGDSEDENMEEDSATNVTSTSMGTSGASRGRKRK